MSHQATWSSQSAMLVGKPAELVPLHSRLADLAVLCNTSTPNGTVLATTVLLLPKQALTI